MTSSEPSASTLRWQLVTTFRNICSASPHFTAWQLYVARGGEVLIDAADGDCPVLGPISSGSLFHAYCLSKPVVGLSALALVERYDLDLDAALAGYLRAESAPAEIEVSPDVLLSSAITIRSLLTHSAGMHLPDAALFRLTLPRNHGRLVASAAPFGARAAYSEYLAGWFLDWLCRSVSGYTLVHAVDMWVCHPVALQDGVLFDGGVARPRVVAPLGGLPDRRIPFLSEISSDGLADVCPAFGGLYTARGLGEFWRLLGQSLKGEQVNGWPRVESIQAVLRQSRGAVYDHALRRSADFAMFSMVNMASHGLSPRLSEDSLGHTTGQFPGFAALQWVSTGESLVIVFSANGQGRFRALQDLRRAIVDTVLDEALACPRS